MDEMRPSMNAGDRRHEQRDIRLRPIVILGIGLLILAGLTMGLMGWLFNHFAARQAKLAVPAAPLAATQQPPPTPHLEVVPDRLLRELRAEEDAVLHSYGWADRQAGVVRIPIERAMALLAERGLPFRANDRGSGRTEDRGSKVEDRP